jgi:ribonuclease R
MKKKTISGVISITRKGTGYVSWPEDSTKEDIEIENNNLAGALNGDTVEVSLTSLFPRPKGAVVQIITRAKEEFVCTLKDNAGSIVAVPDDIKFYRPIQINKSNFDINEKVLVHLDSFDGKSDPKGSIVSHLGHAGEHRVEMNSIVLEHGFHTDFPEAVAREAHEIEANHASIIESEVPKRADYRETPTFTIDPKDAKDFDDALSIVDFGNGEYEIGVHIADATFFAAQAPRSTTRQAPRHLCLFGRRHDPHAPPRALGVSAVSKPTRTASPSLPSFG